MTRPATQIPAPESPVAQAGLLMQQKKYAEAQAILEKQLRLGPDDAGAWCYLSIALRQQGLYAAAVAAATRARELAPEEPVILSNLGSALRQVNRLESLDAHAQAARLAPDNFDIRLNRAIALHDLCGPQESLAEFDAALALRPGDVNARFERSAVLLQLGRLDEGLKDYSVRWHREGAHMPAYKIPQWEGQDIAGKTILVWEEQGAGDTLLASRYLPLVKARGGRVLFGCQPALRRLFQSLSCVDRFVDPGPIDEKIHYHVPLLSLLGIFGTRLDTIPLALPLHVPALKPETARLLALGRNRVKIGIVWSGNTAFPNNRQRAVHAARFLPLAAIPGVQLYSLQKGAPENELDDIGADGLIVRLGPHLHDFAETAAVVSQLDQIIMTDSAVAHLAGTLGRPVWNLLNFNAYWLYLRDRGDCPWYPSMQLVRQPRPGDWDTVFSGVADAIKRSISLTQKDKSA